MDSEIKTWLYDVLQSIAEIESYFEDRPKIFDDKPMPKEGVIKYKILSKSLNAPLRDLLDYIKSYTKYGILSTGD